MSDKPNALASYEGTPVASERARENRIVMRFDSEGYACDAPLLAPNGTSADFIALMRKTKAPIDPNDIVMPDGWTLDHETGIASKVVRQDGQLIAALTTDHILLPDQ